MLKIASVQNISGRYFGLILFAFWLIGLLGQTGQVRSALMVATSTHWLFAMLRLLFRQSGSIVFLLSWDAGIAVART
jgi:hypothetical protein